MKGCAKSTVIRFSFVYKNKAFSIFHRPYFIIKLWQNEKVEKKNTSLNLIIITTLLKPS